MNVLGLAEYGEVQDIVLLVLWSFLLLLDLLFLLAGEPFPTTKVSVQYDEDVNTAQTSRVVTT
jgi:hypothetical protein